VDLVLLCCAFCVEHDGFEAALVVCEKGLERRHVVDADEHAVGSAIVGEARPILTWNDRPAVQVKGLAIVQDDIICHYFRRAWDVALDSSGIPHAVVG